MESPSVTEAREKVAYYEAEIKASEHDLEVDEHFIDAPTTRHKIMLDMASKAEWESKLAAALEEL